MDVASLRLEAFSCCIDPVTDYVVGISENFSQVDATTEDRYLYFGSENVLLLGNNIFHERCLKSGTTTTSKFDISQTGLNDITKRIAKFEFWHEISTTNVYDIVIKNANDGILASCHPN